MANTAELVIKVLADTSQAQASFASMAPILGGLGIGVAGAGSAAVLKVASDYQSAMAIVQSANAKMQQDGTYGAADFAPGTSRYEAAANKIKQISVDLATSQKDVAEAYAQGTRFIDEQGQHLSTDKLNEYTDTTIRLAKVSTDHISALQAGQSLDVFEKLYGQTNFAQVGSELAALSNIHNQGEAITMATAIPLAQYGAEMGVSQEQSLGVATYLADRGAGGGMAGASIGRMFQRMDASADSALDPEVKASAAKKARNAQEHLDDLQTSLKEAELKHSEMYGQHGLKTAYRRNPEAVMAEDDRIAKLKREIRDAQDDMAAEKEAAKAPARGKMDIGAMADTAGMSLMDFAHLVKTDPMDAMIAFTTGLHNLPEQMRGAAERAAGLINTRDIKTVNVLAAEPDTLKRIIGEAESQRDAPTALAVRSDITFGTAQQHLQQLENALRNDTADLGANGLPVADAGIQGATRLAQGEGIDGFIKKLMDGTDILDKFNAILSPLSGAIQPIIGGLALALPTIISNLLKGRSGTAAADTKAEAAPAEATTSVDATRTARVDKLMKALDTTDRAFAEQMLDRGQVTRPAGAPVEPPSPVAQVTTAAASELSPVASAEAAGPLAAVAIVQQTQHLVEDIGGLLHGKNLSQVEDERKAARASEQPGFLDRLNASLTSGELKDTRTVQPPASVSSSSGNTQDAGSAQAPRDVNVTVGDVHPSGPNLEDILSAVTTRITSAWNAANKGTPVAGAMGGNYNTSNLTPR